MFRSMHGVDIVDAFSGDVHVPMPIIPRITSDLAMLYAYDPVIALPRNLSTAIALESFLGGESALKILRDAEAWQTNPAGTGVLFSGTATVVENVSLAAMRTLLHAGTKLLNSTSIRILDHELASGRAVHSGSSQFLSEVIKPAITRVLDPELTAGTLVTFDSATLARFKVPKGKGTASYTPVDDDYPIWGQQMGNFVTELKQGGVSLSYGFGKVNNSQLKGLPGNDLLTLLTDATRITLYRSLSVMEGKQELLRLDSLGIADKDSARGDILNRAIQRKLAYIGMCYALLPYIWLDTLFEKILLNPSLKYLVTRALEAGSMTDRFQEMDVHLKQFRKLPKLFMSWVDYYDPFQATQLLFGRQTTFTVYPLPSHAEERLRKMMSSSSGTYLTPEKLANQRTLSALRYSPQWSDLFSASFNGPQGKTPNIFRCMLENRVSLFELFRTYDAKAKDQNLLGDTFHQVASMLSWDASPTSRSLSPAVVDRTVLVSDGHMASAPVKNLPSLQATRAVFPSVDRGAPALFTIDESLPTPTSVKTSLGQISFLNMSGAMPVYVPTSRLTDEYVAVGGLVDPKDYALSAAGSSLENDLRNMGNDVMEIPNTDEGWASHLGITVDELAAVVGANAIRWAHLVTVQQGATGSTLVWNSGRAVTSSTIRVKGHAVRLVLPSLTPKFQVLFNGARPVTAHIASQDAYVRDYDATPITVDMTMSLEHDINLILPVALGGGDTLHE